VCADSVLYLECPLDQLLNVYDIWMGVAEDTQKCTPKGFSSKACKVNKQSDLDKVVNVRELCQNKTLCELSFPNGHGSAGTNSDGNTAPCRIYVLSLTYLCVSKYCIKINKSLRLLALLAVSANTDKAIYGTIPNTLHQHYIDFCSQYIRARNTNWCVNIVSAFTRVTCI